MREYICVEDIWGGDIRANQLGYQIALSHLAYRVDRMMKALLVLGTCGALSDFVLTRSLWMVFPWLRLSPQK